MLNTKRLSIIALLLLLVGTLGSILTYNLIEKNELVTKEIDIADDNFKNIDISTKDMGIELIPTNGNSAIIEISGHDLKNNFSSNVSDSTLSIIYNESKWKLYNLDFATNSAKMKVHVPKKVYDTIRVHGNNGSLSAEGLDANKVDFKANDGAIELKNISADSLTAISENGKIKTENLIGSTFNLIANDGRINSNNITADSISIVSHNGRIELNDVKGELSAKANDGSINLITDTLDYPIDFSTHNGKIDIQTNNEPKNAVINAQADNGSITIFGENKSHAIFGLGENKIKLSSNDGRINVKHQ